MDTEPTSQSVKEFFCKIQWLKETDVQELHQVIDQLNSLHFDYIKENEIFEELLCSIAKLLPNNDHILSKFCSLVYFLVHKKKIVLHQTSLEQLTTFFMSAIRSSGAWICSDILVALSAVIENGADKLEKFYGDLIGKKGILMHLLDSNNDEKNIQYNAIQCILNLLKQLDETFLSADLLDICYQKSLTVLKEKLLCKTIDILLLKTIISALKILQHIFSMKSLVISNFGELLGSLKNFLFFGLPGQTFVSDINLYPTLQYPTTQHLESQSESDTTFPKLKKSKRNKRRLKKTHHKRQHEKEVSEQGYSDSVVAGLSNGISGMSFPSRKNLTESYLKNSSSDSEPSDAESHISKIKALQSTLRQNAYIALQSVFKASDKKVLFGYWTSFLPEHPTLPGIIPSQNIFTTILKDPIPQVRLCALTFLAEVLRGSKQFLLLADGRNVKQISFTSLSSILATMIYEIHRCLLLTLLSENSNILLTQILKCYSVLAENVPYNKLNKEILFKFLKHIKGYTIHKDIQVQIACLAVFDSITNSEQMPLEVEELLLCTDFENAINVLISSSHSSLTMLEDYNKLPWIVEVCHKNIFNEEPLPVKIQSIQLIISIVAKYFQKTLNFFTIISEIVLCCLDNDDTSLQLHGAKLLDVVGRCTNSITNVELEKTGQPLVSVLWKNVLRGPFLKCLTNEGQSTLQAICCDCLSTLSSSDFESLPEKQQISYIAILLGLTADSNPNVRGAAIRCLGLYCLFSCLTQDSSFLDDVAVILIKSVEDTNMNVRLKASWSLGNLSDALFLNRDRFLLCKEISPQFFHAVGMTCVEFSKDSDRVKVNAVRALGNLLKYIPEELIDIPMMQDFIKDSCKVLIAALSVKLMKVCWNACYALGNMLQNDQIIGKGIINVEDVLNSLLIVLKSPNFKVRISAAQALTALNSRQQYGPVFENIWHHLLSALFSISKDVNFKEAKHQENLHDQLCFGISRMITLALHEDISIITKTIVDSQDMIFTSMLTFASHFTPEKSAVLNDAVEKITKLKDESHSNDTSSELLILIDILNQTILAFQVKDDL